MLLQLEDASRDLQRRADELAMLKIRNDELRTQLDQATQAAQQAASDFERKKSLLNAEVDELRLQLQSTDSEAFERLSDLNAHIEDLLHEKATVEAALDDSKLKIERLKEQRAQKVVSSIDLINALICLGCRILPSFEIYATPCGRGDLLPTEYAAVRDDSHLKSRLVVFQAHLTTHQSFDSSRGYPSEA